MLHSDRIAIDASFLLKIFLPEDKSDQAEELWKKWIADSVEVVAPTLIAFEVASVIRNGAPRAKPVVPHLNTRLRQGFGGLSASLGKRHPP